MTSRVPELLRVCTLCGLLILPLHGLAQDEAELPLDELRMFSEAFGMIKREYVDDVDDRTLLIHAIRGMLSGLDVYSEFLEPEEFTQMRITTFGQFGGIGIEINSRDGYIEIVAPIDDTPAHDAGLQSGDVILAIDGESTYGITLKEAVDQMRGEPGTAIRFTIGRKGEKEPIELELVRAVINVTSVRSEMLEPGYGYIRVSSFTTDSAQKLRSQIKNLLDMSDGVLKGLILDLRNNPGGVLSGAVEVSDMFLEQGSIVTTKGRTEESRKIFSANPDDVIQSTPMVVLVNRGSASASEIVAGALQDHKRAVILGVKTFGKGLVQSILPMDSGSVLKLTTAKYYTPDERSIQDKGITPDIIVERSSGSVAGDQNEMVDDESSATQDEQNIPADQSDVSEDRNMGFSDDYQLVRALNVLKGKVTTWHQNEPSGG